ncbi:MAG: SDR family oxidoreductase [Erythrobacter sp.]|uniref:SDR family NAD(P)-dependent oxidoreductase n=1 Tax=Erythrobacter sp. TaxID=1042 RepID=UPI0025FE16E8|nr:SDR family oxidoreductase [Erythrobacter sp.]MCL9998787.1 SDR family oxidoreductase [Erythrobacter sp.]
MTDDGSLAGAIAVVTGAASGIGLATAHALAEADAAVWLVDRDAEALADALDSCRGGAQHVAWHLDVTSEAGWLDFFAAVDERHGRLDILINNAGAAHPQPIAQTSLAEWRSSLAVNCDSVFLGTRTMLPLLARSLPWSRRSASAIVNVSSVRGMIGGANFAAYCAAKGAVRMFTKAAALECVALGQRVRVNSVHPGFIETPLARAALDPEALARRVSGIPLQRGGNAEEVAAAILFLASEASSYMTGAELVVDGGTLAG